MDPFSDAELAFLEQVRTPAHMATADPNGTPHVIPVDWSLSADNRSIELERTDLLEIAAIDLDGVDTAALVIDVVHQPGRSQGIALSGPIEQPAGSPMARLRPARVVAWGFDGASDGVRETQPPDDAARHPLRGGPVTPGRTMAVVRRSSYDTDALARGRAQMARFERIHAAQPGYAGNVVVDLGKGERLVVTLWASEEHAAAARGKLTPVVRELLEPMERTPSRLLGVGPVVTTDLTLASGASRADRGRHRRPANGESSRFQPEPDVVTWRMRFHSPPEVVYRALTTEEGRASFWAERTVERGDAIAFEFPGGVTSQAHVLDAEQDRLFRIDYFGAVVAFELEPTRDGGTDLRLVTHGFAPDERTELTAGWLSVLFPLKAFVDHGVDLRNHDPDRTWLHGYADQ